MTGDTFEKIKKGIKETAEDVKETAEKVTDTDTYTGSDEEKKNRDYNESGGKEPMSPKTWPLTNQRQSKEIRTLGLLEKVKQQQTAPRHVKNFAKKE